MGRGRLLACAKRKIKKEKEEEKTEREDAPEKLYRKRRDEGRERYADSKRGNCGDCAATEKKMERKKKERREK